MTSPEAEAIARVETHAARLNWKTARVRSDDLRLLLDLAKQVGGLREAAERVRAASKEALTDYPDNDNTSRLYFRSALRAIYDDVSAALQREPITTERE